MNPCLPYGWHAKGETVGIVLHRKGLYLFFLPKYSPHLNLAETFWRKAKYEWLKPADYLSFEKFKEKVIEIFANNGTKYLIKFKEQNCQAISA